MWSIDRFVLRHALQAAACASVFLSISATHARALHVDEVEPPNKLMPGDRSMNLRVRLDGAPRAQTSVFVYYAETAAELVKVGATTPRGQASCKSADGGLSCSFVFPHGDFRDVNILTAGELDGGEPPAARPTYIDLLQQAALGGGGTGSTRLVATDKNALRIGAPNRAYYRVAVESRVGTGTQRILGDVGSFKMPRTLVVAVMGDSYSSGEGAPDRAAAPGRPAAWADAACHRSHNSGQMGALYRVIREHPGLAIAYLNVACSGAEIDKGIMNPQDGPPGDGSKVVPSQLRQLATWMDAHNRATLDILLLGAGGNNAGFGDVGVSCMAAVLPCADDKALWQRVKTRLEALPDALADLQGRLSKLNIGRVLIAEYPDATRNARGDFCNTSGSTYPGTCWGLLELKIPASDFQAIYTRLITPLNQAVQAAAKRFDWTLIGAIEDRSHDRGICSSCEKSTFNTVGQSLFTQGDHFGSLHPSEYGYRTLIEPSVYKDLRLALRGMLVEAARATAAARAAATAKQGPDEGPAAGPFVKDASALALTPPRRALPPLLGPKPAIAVQPVPSALPSEGERPQTSATDDNP